MKKSAYILLLFIGIVSSRFSFANDVFSTESNPSKITINTYPNPATGIINVEINGDYSIQFYDLVGQKLEIEIVANNSFGELKKSSYDIQKLTKGIYFIKVSDKINKTQKMIKFQKL